MTTATIDTNTEATTAARRTPVQRPRPNINPQPRLVEARKHAETAVTDLMSASTETFRAFLPAAVLRPTEAVEYTFDLLEQMLAASRRVWFEMASIMETGIDSVERRSA